VGEGKKGVRYLHCHPDVPQGVINGVSVLGVLRKQDLNQIDSLIAHVVPVW